VGLVEWRIKHLDSKRVWKRRRAADALSRALSRKAILQLLISVRDPDEEVRLIAAKGLGKVQARGAIQYIISLLKGFPKEKCPHIADILINYGEMAVGDISSVLSSPDCDPQTRFWSVRALAEIGPPADKLPYKNLESVLRRFLMDSSPEVRGYSGIALAKFSSDDNFLDIQKLLSDESALVRVCAARALGILKTSQALDALVNTIEDPEWDVNYAAAEILLDFGDSYQEIESKLKVKYQDPDTFSYKRSMELIEKMGWKRNDIL
ncbi:HEAT repeat domain-containing protein, partial [Bdellovibrionota bacterium]